MHEPVESMCGDQVFEAVKQDDAVACFIKKAVDEDGEVLDRINGDFGFCFGLG